MTGLKIVWRNPAISPRKRRWHELSCTADRRWYVIEELVAQGDQKRWGQSIALEVIPAAERWPATQPEPPTRVHGAGSAGSGGW